MEKEGGRGELVVSEHTSMSFAFFLWFSWVNTLENTEATKIFEAELQSSDSLRAIDVLGCFFFF